MELHEKIATAWLLRLAKYNPEFLQWVGGQRYRNDDTGERVLFQSLPSGQQTKMFALWKKVNQGEGAEKRKKENRWLSGNQNPDRYEHVEFKLHLDDETEEEDRKRLAAMFGTENEDEMRDAILDLAGAGGIASLVETVQVLTWDDNYDSKVNVVGKGKHGLSFERIFTYDETGDEDQPWMGSGIENKFFEVSSKAPPGVGTRMLASQVGAAEGAGFSHIQTEAARAGGLNGYYTWPRLGFNAGLTREDLEDLEEYDPEAAWEVQQLAEADDNRSPMFEDDPIELFHVMAVPAARKWWEKEGHTIPTVFSVSDDYDGGKAYQILREYTEAKAMAEGQTIPEYLSKIGAKKKKNMPPELTEQDNKILNRVWENVRKRVLDKAKKKKEASIAGSWLRLQIVKSSLGI